MTRRDIIIIAVLANIGVLALLFILAFRAEDEKVADSSQIVYQLSQEPAKGSFSQEPEVVKPDPSDDNDALVDDGAPLADPTPMEDDAIHFADTDSPPPAATTPAPVPTPQTPPGTLPEATPVRVVDVTVKKGDVLEKIAKANGTTVEAIMRASQLTSDKLKIGQVLQVPVGNKVAKPAPTSAPKAAALKAPVAQAEVQYYTVKAGDNPWRIAKQFNIKVDDLLRLNKMNEESARNLKVGDKIRVH